MSAPEHMTPFELGRLARREALARGEVPSREALDLAAAVIAASQDRAAEPDQKPGAAA